jgi:hypothetical protein
VADSPGSTATSGAFMAGHGSRNPATAQSPLRSFGTGAAGGGSGAGAM